MLAYLPTLGYGFVWDDETFIAQNPAAQDLGRLGESLSHGYGWVAGGEVRADAYLYFRPVIVAANALHWAVGGGRPWVFHLGNLLTHALCAALVAGILLLLDLPGWVAILGGSVFALHPVHSEAVAWISGRTDVTAALFGWSALAILLFWQRRPGRRWLPVVAALALLLALGAKESALGFVVLASWLIVTARTEGRRPRGLALALTILVAVIGIYVLWRWSVLDSVLGSAAGHETGSGLPERGPLAERALLGGNLFLLYIWRWFVPWTLAVEGPTGWAQPPYPRVMGTAGLALIALAAVIWFIGTARRLRGAQESAEGRRRDPEAKAAGRVRGTEPAAAVRRAARGAPEPAQTLLASEPFLLGLGLWLATLLPVLQWIPTGEIYGERFLYLPSGGLVLMLGALAARAGRIRARTTVLLLVLIGVPALARLESRLPAWRDARALFASAVASHPHSPRAHANLGSVLMERGALQEAERHLARARQLDPDDARTQAQHGALLVNLGRVDEGVRALEDAAQRMTSSKTLLKNLGVGRLRQGRFEEAASVLRQALERDPDDVGLLETLAMVERKRGNLEAATELFEQVVAGDPSRKSAYLNLIGLHFFDRRDEAAGRMWGERFLSRFPHAPEAEDTRRLLAQSPTAIDSVGREPDKEAP